MRENVVLVDEQDNPIGLEEKMQAHRKGLLHRAFSVFVFNKEGELLLQQRAKEKYHCGGLWTNTCCSHPRDKEDIVKAGERRLQEELGFTVSLKNVGSFIYRAEFTNGLTEHELDHVLVGNYNDEGVVINTDEVVAYNWVTIADLKDSLAKTPERYTPWLPKALARI